MSPLDESERKRPRLSLSVASSWQAQWAAVPAEWQTPAYRIDTTPADEVFLRNRYYLREHRANAVHDFTPTAAPSRFADELAWWVWVCWSEQLRKVEPSLLRWASQALSAAAIDHRHRHGRAPASIADLTAADIVRQAVVLFERRNGRLPSPGSRRNIAHLIEHLHLMVAVRCTETHWWAHDVWDLRADPRIPQREHEPRHDLSLRLGGIEPDWLREGLRFWLRTALSTELLRWSSVVDRGRSVGRHLGAFARQHNYTDPLLTDDPHQLRLIFTDFSDYLHTKQASGRPDRDRLSDSAIDAVQSETQTFYTFMFDHAPEAAAAIGDPRWAQITAAHTRLWGPALRTRAKSNERDLTWYSTSDLQRMLGYLDVLAADRGTRVTITHPDNTISMVKGLGDPQAARIWLLQALTGRRASEILMLDHVPLDAIPGLERPTDVEQDDPDAFVAKLRYQQTKVDGIVPTILVEQAVVNVIAEQQQWLRDTHPGLEPKYLFLPPRTPNLGRRPRPYSSYRTSLERLDDIHGLTDSAGNPLRFTQTHRLRHTRATELLNDGVPIHVVQRYLGHKSPEMTMRYAATLAATAEAEFLKHKKIGAHGTDIGVSPSDIYTMTQLSQRTDRILPNGVCLLPPLKNCDKGNACLSCGHFATDATHLDELRDQRSKTAALIEVRRKQYRQRAGRELTDDNVWIRERLRELASLDAIIARLTADTAVDIGDSVSGAGTRERLPLLQIRTRGAHETVLRKADPGTAQ